MHAYQVGNDRSEISAYDTEDPLERGNPLSLTFASRKWGDHRNVKYYMLVYVAHGLYYPNIIANK